MRKQFAQGVASRLIYYPFSLPTGAQVSLSLLDEAGGQWGDVANPQTISLESTQTTVATDGKKSDQTLTVASVTGFVVDRIYLVVLADGFFFPIRILGANAGVLRLDGPLADAVPAGSVVRGLAAIRTITTNETAIVARNLQAVWSWARDGETLLERETFDVVQYPFWFNLTPADVESEDHQFSDYAGRLRRWRRVIEAAHGDVDALLRGQQLYPENFLDRDLLKTAVICALLEQYHINTPARSVYFREKKTELVRRAVASFARYNETAPLESGGSTGGVIRARPPAGGMLRVV